MLDVRNEPNRKLLISPQIEHDGNFPVKVYKLTPYRLTSVDSRVLATIITPKAHEYLVIGHYLKWSIYVDFIVR